MNVNEMQGRLVSRFGDSVNAYCTYLAVAVTLLPTLQSGKGPATWIQFNHTLRILNVTRHAAKWLPSTECVEMRLSLPSRSHRQMHHEDDS